MKNISIRINFLFNTFLSISSLIFPLITYPYASRILGADGIGRVTFATSVIAYFLMLAQLGIPTYGVRACSRVRDDKKKLSERFSEILALNLITSLCSYILLFIIVFSVPRFSNDKYLYIVGSLTILLNTIGVEWLYKALEEYKYISIRSIIFKLISVIALYILVRKNTDYIQYMCVTLIASSGSYICNFIKLSRFIEFVRPKFRNIISHLKDVIIFFSMNCATTIYTNLDSVMLGIMTDDSQVGYYSTAIKIKTLLATVVSSLGVVILPRVSFYVATKQDGKFRNIIIDSLKFVILLSTPLIVFFIFFSRNCILFLGGVSFAESIVPMQISLISLLFIGLTNILGMEVLVPLGKEKIVLLSVSVAAVSNILLNIYFIPKYGVVGATVSMVIAEVIVFMIQSFFLKRLLRNTFKSISVNRIIVASLVSAILPVIINYFLPNYLVSLALGFIIYFVSYLIILILFKEPLVLRQLKEMTGNLNEK